MKTIYSALYSGFHPLDTWFPHATCVAVDHVNQLTEQEAILILHGGSDISPTLYGQKVGQWTGADAELSRRDRIEKELATRAKEMGIPIFGICRGAQLLCALAGGVLVQDVDNHAGRGHLVTTKDGEEIIVNSIHHQMQWPEKAKHQLLAWSKEPLSPQYLGEDGPLKHITHEPEAVYYPEWNGLGFQWHPEMMPANHPANAYVRKTIKEFWNV